jgi:hypothetical protein
MKQAWSGSSLTGTVYSDILGLIVLHVNRLGASIEIRDLSWCRISWRSPPMVTLKMLTCSINLQNYQIQKIKVNNKIGTSIQLIDWTRQTIDWTRQTETHNCQTVNQLTACHNFLLPTIGRDKFLSLFSWEGVRELCVDRHTHSRQHNFHCCFSAANQMRGQWLPRISNNLRRSCGLCNQLQSWDF